MESKFFGGKLVKWTGTVLRVDSFDEDAEYLKIENEQPPEMTKDDVKNEIE